MSRHPTVEVISRIALDAAAPLGLTAGAIGAGALRAGRDQGAVTRIAVAFAVAALALSILFSAALTLPSWSGAPASGHRPLGPSAPGAGREVDGRQNPPRRDRQPHRQLRGLACVPALAIAGFTRIVRWPLILSVPRLAAEFSRTEGITIKLVIRGTSAGFADAR